MNERRIWTGDDFSGLFNSDQREVLAELANLPDDKRAACGWHHIAEPCPSGSCDRKSAEKQVSVPPTERAIK